MTNVLRVIVVLLSMGCALPSAASGVPVDPLTGITLLIDRYGVSSEVPGGSTVQVRHAATRGHLSAAPFDVEQLISNHQLCVQSRRMMGASFVEIPHSAFPRHRATIVKQGFQQGDVYQRVELKSALEMHADCNVDWRVSWDFTRMVLGHPNGLCRASTGSERVPNACADAAVTLDALRHAFDAPPPAVVGEAPEPDRVIAGLPCELQTAPLPLPGSICFWRLFPPRGGSGFGDLPLEVTWGGGGKSRLEASGVAWVRVDLFRGVPLIGNEQLSGVKP